MWRAVKVKVKVKVKCTLIQALRLCRGWTAHRRSRGIALPFLDHDTWRGWRVSFTLRPLFTPGKSRYPLYRRLCGPLGRSGQVRKISPPPGFDPRTIQPVARHYTDWATRPVFTCMYVLLFLIGCVFVVCYFIYFLLRFSVIPIGGFCPFISTSITNNNSIIITVSFSMQVILTTYHGQITSLIIVIVIVIRCSFIAVSNIKTWSISPS